ncbi:tryptophan synthase subunit alpha [Clostridium sp. DL1XJH146]
MNRIDEKFIKLKEENKKALITFLTAGHPTIDKTERLIYALEKAGSDIIEVGIPFSDPLADGPVIQKASQHAIDNGITLRAIFDCIERVRENSDIPLLFLVYYNSIFSYGIEKFISKCTDIGIDGLIIPDLPLEEQDEIMPYIANSDIALIPFATPTSGERVKDTTKNMKGFVYCVSSLGVTGMKDSFYNNIQEYLEKVRKHTDMPLAIGFGIKSKEDIKRFEPLVDAVIVGTAIVKCIEESNGDTEKVIEFVKKLR